MTVVIGKKLGMSRIYLENGAAVPVTLIKVYESVLSDFKKYNDKDFNLITLSYGKDKKTERKINKSVLGFYKKKNLESYNKMKTFKVPKNQEFSVGSIVGLDQFKQGYLLDVTGVSRGKGFAGAVKRHGFGGQMTNHGESLSERSLGSTGSRRREGKVFKNKRMAGHMGSEQVTVKNLEIIKIENEDCVICVKGAVPGYKGSELIIKESKV
jgi:large subunit ribosomal protein L3